MAQAMLRLSRMKRTPRTSIGIVAVGLILGVGMAGAPRAAVRVCSGEAWLAKSDRTRVNWRVRCEEGTGSLTIWLRPGYDRSQTPSQWPKNFSRSLNVSGDGVASSCVLSKARSTVSCQTSREGAATFSGWVAVERGRRCRSRVVISSSGEVSVQRPGILESPKEYFFNGLPKGCT